MKKLSVLGGTGLLGTPVARRLQDGRAFALFEDMEKTW